MTRQKDLKPVCRWALEPVPAWSVSVYDSGCGAKLDLVNGGPSAYGFSYCPFCGKPLIQKKERG